MKKICVLMTTYNPNCYLDEQIESIFCQKNVEVEIVIRDDASQDKSFLEKYVNDSRITIIWGEKNLGVAENIRQLAKYIIEEKQKFQFYAYSDQDDVWLDDKLETMINELEGMDYNIPGLYYSNLLVVDENLNPSHELFKRGVVKNSLGQALSQVFLFACTSGFNYEMLKEIIKYDFQKLGFDSLLYYIGIINKQIKYDDVPHILYRQHGNNLSGQKEKGIRYVFNKTKKVLLNNEATFRYNAEFILDSFSGKLSENDRRLVRQVASYKTLKDRLRLIMNKNIKAGYQPKDLYIICRLILGRY